METEWQKLLTEEGENIFITIFQKDRLKKGLML